MDRGKGFAYFRAFCLELDSIANADDWRETMKRFCELNHG